MSFNLNDGSFGGSNVVIFNNGIAGKVDNVTMSITKKSAADADNIPPYKVVFTDEQGASVNQGFYYHQNNPNNNEQKNADNERYLVSRVLSIAKAVLPADFVFEEFSTSKEVIDYLFKLTHQHAEGKKFSVFVTYGTKNKPSKYLGLRFFQFVEALGTQPSRLVVNNTDQMERVVADEPQVTGTESSTNGVMDTW